MACLGLEVTLTDPKGRFRDLEPESGSMRGPRGLWCGVRVRRTGLGHAPGNATVGGCRRMYRLEQCFSWSFGNVFILFCNFRARGNQDRNSCDFYPVCCRAVQQAFLIFFSRVSNELKFCGRLLAAI